MNENQSCSSIYYLSKSALPPQRLNVKGFSFDGQLRPWSQSWGHASHHLVPGKVKLQKQTAELNFKQLRTLAEPPLEFRELPGVALAMRERMAFQSQDGWTGALCNNHTSSLASQSEKNWKWLSLELEALRGLPLEDQGAVCSGPQVHLQPEEGLEGRVEF